MLKISNLRAGYFGPPVIKNISFTVAEGEMATLIGPNGAGKSTVLRSIFGLTTIEEGEVDFFGTGLTKVKTSEIIKQGIAYVPQGRSVFPSLTVEENLEMGAFISSDRNKMQNSIKSVYKKFSDLKKFSSTKAGLLSGGQQQMVAIARALLLNPKLILLDEPSIGLAPKIVADVFKKCREIKEEGTSILMVEQNAMMALEYSDTGYVLELGELKLKGKGPDLLKNKKVAELYLGASV